MVTEEQALCIVNTKRHAHELFCALGDSQTDIFHLSTNMTPQHRKATLKIIRQRLADNLPCKVISTQLIEAGVDIDFPVVFRAAAGIDSVAQAAGRCNREGRLKFGCVYVFVPEEIYRGKGYLRRTADCGLLTIQKYPQFLENTAVREYFSKLFDVERDGFDKKEIMQLCARSVADMPDLQIPYEKIGNAFKIIENEDYSLVIPQNDYVVNILGKAEYVKTLGGILRDLSQYTVGVKAYELAKLAEQGALNIVAGSIAVLVDENLYNDQYGLLLATTDQFDYIL